MRVLLGVEKTKDLYSGLGQFSLHLARALLADDEHTIDYTALLHVGQPELFGILANYRRLRWIDRYSKLPGAFDAWHNFHQEAKYWPRDSRTPTILTVHDLNFLHRADYSPGKRRRKLAEHQANLDRADVIATISAYAAAEVATQLDLRGKRIHVIPNGCPPAVDFDETDALSSVARPFVLGLGVLHPRKNWEVLLPLLLRLPDLQLVLAGHDGGAYAKTLRTRATELGLTHRVTFAGVVTDAQKAWLIEHCEALWFPSLSEGFGIPPVEAMRVGKPVFLSTCTSLPEVGGEVAFYWPTFEPDDMARVYVEGMATYAADPQLAARLIAHASRFTWERAAKSYAEIYLAARTHHLQ